jgi:hypothetical protein
MGSVCTRPSLLRCGSLLRPLAAIQTLTNRSQLQRESRTAGIKELAQQDPRCREAWSARSATAPRPAPLARARHASAAGSRIVRISEQILILRSGVVPTPSCPRWLACQHRITLQVHGGGKIRAGEADGRPSRKHVVRGEDIRSAPYRCSPQVLRCRRSFDAVPWRRRVAVAQRHRSVW